MIFQSTSDLNLARPFWQHADLFPPGTHCFLLDSAMDPEHLGRQSFMGGMPAAVLTGKRLRDRQMWPIHWEGEHPGGGQPFHLELTIWKKPDGVFLGEPEKIVWAGDPFEALRQLQTDYGVDTGPPRTGGPSFSGGLVGYFGYESAYCIEDLPDQGLDEPSLPDLAFMVADGVMCLDHLSGRATLTVTGRGPDLETATIDASLVEECWRGLLVGFPESKSEVDPGPVKIQGHFDLNSYGQAVQACREHILAGDVFEVCLTQRLETDFSGSPWSLYCRLRHINPAPFAAWLQFPDFQVVSASPERFLKLDADRVAESRPIKGTRPRGSTPEVDARLRAELADSEKDRAENLMIVDLVRNDLGRVGKIGSVEVPELLAVEEYATVFQLVSTVRCLLRPECDALDLVRACYPGGSMTGAPKIEAMKIIDSLEPVKRGIYSGAIGYLDRGGAMDLSMVIRTIVCTDGRAYFGVGGAVTADSDPQDEYRETMDKARALVRALGAEMGGELP
jgi:para-aminobenzoate synthetase component 1